MVFDNRQVAAVFIQIKIYAFGKSLGLLTNKFDMPKAKGNKAVRNKFAPSRLILSKC